MILNYIWVAFFLIAFLLASIRLFIFHDAALFGAVMQSTFELSKKGFEISLGLTGAMTLWLGLMKVGEAGGLIQALAKLTGPFFKRLFPEIPENHPVLGNILMNYSANMLGLDHAATPLGLKAIAGLQELNPEKERASNAMIMFMAINTAGLTIIPVGIMAVRLQLGAVNPADIFLPCLIGTAISSLSAVIIVGIMQRINLLDPVLLLWLGGIGGAIGSAVWYLSTLSEKEISDTSAVVGAFILFSIVTLIIGTAFFRKINVFETFVEGAKEGFETAVKIIPYIVGILVGIGVFRASGALGYITDGLGWVFISMGFDEGFIPALPVGIIKPFSGSGARGLMIETMKEYGVDSFVGRMVSVLQGSTETTFYTLAVYFGSVNIKKIRYAAGVGLIVDFIGIVAAIFLAYLFFK